MTDEEYFNDTCNVLGLEKEKLRRAILFISGSGGGGEIPEGTYFKSINGITPDLVDSSGTLTASDIGAIDATKQAEYDAYATTKANVDDVYTQDEVNTIVGNLDNTFEPIKTEEIYLVSTTAQALSTTPVSIIFNASPIMTGGFSWSDTVDPDTITIGKSGRYLVRLSLNTDASTNNTITFSLEKDGTVSKGATVSVIRGAGNGGVGAVFFDFIATEKIKILVSSDNPANTVDNGTSFSATLRIKEI